MEPKEPKYKIGDKIFYLDNNLIKSLEIKGICWHDSSSCDYVGKKQFFYAINWGYDFPNKQNWVEESKLFLSKELLIKTL